MKNLLVVPLALSLLACTTIGRSYRPNVLDAKRGTYLHIDPGKLNGTDYRVDLDAAMAQVPCPTHAGAPGSDTCDRFRRNVATYDVMALSDELCGQHLSNILSNANTWNVVSGTATNVLAGIAALGGNPASQANYAAGAVFANSTRSLVDSEIYSQALASTIVTAIRNVRNGHRSDIEQRLATDPVVAYPFAQAFRDVKAYHESCSFYIGIAEITRAVNDEARSSRNTQAEVLGLQNILRTLEDGGATAEQKKLVQDQIDRTLRHLETD